MKKIIFIETDNIERYPPEISVLNALTRISSVDITVCSLCPSLYMQNYCFERNISLINANGENLRGKNYSKIGIIRKIYDYIINKKKIWHAINNVYTNDSILWINTFDTLKFLGKKLLNYKYILHLYELIRETRFFYKFPYPKYKFGLYLKTAYKVIECEYNRACITQAWFGLKNRPIVIPNKLYLDKTECETFQVTPEIVQQMKLLEGKTIILYQGILGPERPVGIIAEAVSELGDDFAMVIMSNSKLDKQYRNLVEIGFINPPNHLYVTQKAHIGILNYQANKNGFSGNDCLNSIYCAPNKLYEYSKYGLPMIGNDIPGLKYTIENSGAGICIENMTKDRIKDAIKKICQNYDEYKQHSLDFYNSVDVKKIIEEEILSED